MKDVVIVGGGASGIMCAIVCAMKGKKVTLMESGVKPGKKIMMSGNGRCNLTNKTISSDNYNVFPKQFEKFDNYHALEFFKGLGLETYFDEEGRCYPISNHASSVLDVLLNKLNQTNCEVISNCAVDNIKRVNNYYEVSTALGVFEAKKVVIATGGNTITKILDELEIEYRPFKPSLCGLKTLQSTQLLTGVRAECEVKAVIKDFVKVEKGEVIFKDDAISGICIFNLSALLNWHNIDNCSLSLNLLPQYTDKQLLDVLQTRKQSLSELTARQFFDGMLHKNLGQEILNRCHIKLNMPVKNFNLSILKNFATHLQNLTFNVCGFENNNQVHSGGVRVGELTDNLESKKYANLYFVGEVVDVDGVCGGYNLQWAWTSGYVVGESV